MINRNLALLLILSSFSLSVNSEIYQWVDEDGVTIYSQTPPVTGEARSITPHRAPESGESKQRLHDMRQRADDLREDRVQKKAAATVAKNEAKRKKENCVAARGNLTRLQSLGHRRYDGARLTEEERQQKIGEAQQHIKENCGQ